jgi:required for meiotic nuclear division protein 1
MKTLTLRASYVGTRINLRALERGEAIESTVQTIRAGERGYAILFRYGAVVLIDLQPLEEAAFLETLEPFIESPFEKPEQDWGNIVIDPERTERIDADGVIVLNQANIERLQIVAHILAKSTVMAHYEEQIGTVFDRIEQFVLQQQRIGRLHTSGQKLIDQLGHVLQTQTSMVGRVEVTEKPEITWDDPQLDRLYERLSIEYELRERDRALSRKLDLISHTSQTYLNLLQHRQSLRVEWYIVVLIVVEIVLFIYDLFFR